MEAYTHQKPCLVATNSILKENELHGLRQCMGRWCIPVVYLDLFLEVEHKSMGGSIPRALAEASSCQISMELGLFVFSDYVTSVKRDQCRADGLSVRICFMETYKISPLVSK